MRTTYTLNAAIAALAFSGGAFGADLFKPVPLAKAARAPESLVSPKAVRVDRETLLALGTGAVIDAALPNGRNARIAIETLERHDNGDLSWSGAVLGDRAGLRATGTTGAAGSYAQIETGDGTWGVVPASPEHDWLFDQTATEGEREHPVRHDDFLIPPEREPSFAPKAACPAVSSMPGQQVVIDVLAVVTPDFAATHGGAAGAETRLNNIFTLVNQYNTASNIALRFRRVATMNVAYQAASTSGDDDANALNAITNGSGNFRNVAGLRNFFGADMVAMFRGPKNTAGNSIAGIAWLNGDGNGNMPAGDARWMYSVHGDWLMPGATLSAHELGHNLGNAHDRPNAAGGIGSTPYAFGHFVCGSGASASCGQAGFNNTGTGFGTIMAYHRPTVAKFASPSLICQGMQSGALSAPCGVADQQDDVRATNCVRATVANFKSSWVGACANLGLDADGDGIPDCIETSLGKNALARDNDIFADTLLFTAQQYRDFLAREGDADGLNFWASEIATGARTRANVIDSLYVSGEFQGTIAPVARLYFAYFLRTPDYAGLTHWVNTFRAGGSLDGISGAFAASPEFAQRYGALDNGQFVDLVYRNVLGRTPDPSGRAHWKGQLDTGRMTRGQVMLGFSESPEFKALVANEVAVTMIYMGMLKRAPDAGGFNHWVDYLDRGNNSLALIGGFLAAAEYRARFL